MATGIVLSLGGSTSATYVSKTNAKLLIISGNSNSVNGANLSGTNTNQMYIGSGQTATFSTAAGSQMLVTQYEE